MRYKMGVVAFTSLLWKTSFLRTLRGEHRSCPTPTSELRSAVIVSAAGGGRQHGRRRPVEPEADAYVRIVFQLRSTNIFTYVVIFQLFNVYFIKICID